MEKTKPTWKKWQKAFVGCAGFLLVFLLIIIGFATWSHRNDPEPKETPEQVRQRKVDKAANASELNLRQYIRASMNDPKSFEHVNTNYWDMGCDTIVLKMTYRGKNAFGGTVTELIRAEALMDGTLIKVTKE